MNTEIYFYSIKMILKQTQLEVLLADKRGKWYGKGIGDIREVSVIVERQNSIIKKK